MLFGPGQESDTRAEVPTRPQDPECLAVVRAGVNALESGTYAANKSGLISRIADDVGISRLAAERLIDTCTDTIETCVAHTGSLLLTGFGSWHLKHFKQQTRTNGLSGGVLDIPAHTIVKFKPGLDLRRLAQQVHDGENSPLGFEAPAGRARPPREVSQTPCSDIEVDGVMLKDMTSITKSDFVKILARRFYVSDATASEYLNAFLRGIAASLRQEPEHRLVITNFGRFELAERKARNGRNPHTKEAITISASKRAKWKPGKQFAEKVRELPASDKGSRAPCLPTYQRSARRHLNQPGTRETA